MKAFLNNSKNNNLFALEAVVKHLPAQVYWQDAEGYILGCSEELVNNLGLKTAQDVIGKKPSAFAKDDYEGARNDLLHQQVMTTGKELEIEVPFQYKNGKEAYFLVRKKPLLDDANQTIGTITISFDITEKREREVTGLDINFEDLITHLPEHVYWQDKEGAIMGCNDLFLKNNTRFNHRHEIIGKKMSDIAINHQEGSRNNNLHERVIQTKEELEIEVPYHLPNGEKVYFLVKKRPLYNKKGDIVGVASISFDITQKKQQEELLKQLELEKNKLSTIELFANSIAHELRTPLATIQLGAKGIEKRLNEHLNNTQTTINDFNAIQKTFENVFQSVKFSQNVINTMLANMKLFSYKNLPQPDMTVYAKPIIQKALDTFPYNDVEEKKLIHWSPDKEEDFSFSFLEDNLIYIFFNLLRNALYFIKKSGKGEIYIWIDKSDNDYNKIHFKDTSAGIDEADLPHVFEKFFTKKPSGIGLGLAFCLAAAENHGGTIKCYSQKGEYTEFIIFLKKNLN